jgi:hypothetical protein
MHDGDNGARQKGMQSIVIDSCLAKRAVKQLRHNNRPTQPCREAQSEKQMGMLGDSEE